MTETNATPQLAPGLSAESAQRAAGIASYLLIPPLAVVGFFRADEHFASRVIGPWLPLVITYAAIAMGCFVTTTILLTRANRRESAAGYTTLWRRNPTLPQLDARTGELVRAAGQPYVSRASWHSRQVGMPATAQSGLDLRQPSWLLSVAGNWQVFIPLLVLPLAIAAGLGWFHNGGIVWLPVLYLAIAALFAVGFGIGALVVNSRRKALRAAAPGDFSFLFTKSKGFRDVRVTWHAHNKTGGVEGGGTGVSADATGLTIWAGVPTQRDYFLPWADVVSVQYDTVANGNNSRPAVLVTYRKEDGALVALPLMNANADAFPLGSKAGATWIASELNAIRTSGTSARIL